MIMFGTSDKYDALAFIRLSLPENKLIYVFIVYDNMFSVCQSTLPENNKHITRFIVFIINSTFQHFVFESHHTFSWLYIFLL